MAAEGLSEYFVWFFFIFHIPLTCNIICFRCTTQWLDIYITYKVTTLVRLVSIWYDYNIIDCIPYVVIYISMTAFITGNLYILIPSLFFTHLISSSQLATINLFSVSMSLIPFCFFIYVFYSMSKLNLIVFTFLSLN